MIRASDSGFATFEPQKQMTSDSLTTPARLLLSFSFLFLLVHRTLPRLVQTKRLISLTFFRLRRICFLGHHFELVNLFHDTVHHFVNTFS